MPNLEVLVRPAHTESSPNKSLWKLVGSHRIPLNFLMSLKLTQILPGQLFPCLLGYHTEVPSGFTADGSHRYQKHWVGHLTVTQSLPDAVL